MSGSPAAFATPQAGREEIMIRSTILALALVLFPVTAFAGQCPALMAEIDAALQTASISDDDKAKVQGLRTKGEELHSSGDHAGSEAALNEAKQILGI
jgi:hypothetical protein